MSLISTGSISLDSTFKNTKRTWAERIGIKRNRSLTGTNSPEEHEQNEKKEKHSSIQEEHEQKNRNSRGTEA
jgi:hypothetical protein